MAFDINTDPYAQTHIWSELSVLRTFQPVENVGEYMTGTGDWTSYWPELYPAIQQGEAERGFAYNADLVTYAQQVLHVHGPMLERLVYNTQKYCDAVTTVEQWTTHLSELNSVGFSLITEPVAKSLVRSRELVEVQISRTQRIALRLTHSQANGYFWKLPKHKIKGYPARIGREYVLYSTSHATPVTSTTTQSCLF